MLFQLTKNIFPPILFWIASISIAVGQEPNSIAPPGESGQTPNPFLVILGNVQDAGSPQSGCKKECCTDLFDNPDPDRMVVCIGLVDPNAGKKYIIEATPDLTRQLGLLSRISGNSTTDEPDGIFLTHAHIGHYTGLIYLGKEAVDSKGIPVFAMPRMQLFLNNNGPWDQLIKRNNIKLYPLKENDPVQLTKDIKITPLLVPHRDEYSETVGFLIHGPEKKALFIPDIDKWSKWDQDIISWIKKVDYAFLDATFFDGRELPGRDMDEIPHPSVEESMKLFSRLSTIDRSKVFFIHLNHTNPLLDIRSAEIKIVREKGFNIAKIGQTHEL